MRICGKRASCFGQSVLRAMLRSERDPTGERLTEGKIEEIRKTYNMRKERKQCLISKTNSTE